MMEKRITAQTFSPDGQYTYTYWVDGSVTNPPLLLIPGFTGTHGDLVNFAREFRDTYFVIIPDFPGWGDSPEGTYHLTIHGYAKFVWDLIESLGIKQKLFIVGHCMGSTVSIEFACLHPEKVKSLSLICVPFLQGKFSDVLFHHLALVSAKTPRMLRPFLFFFRSRLFAIPSGFFVIQTKSLRKKLSIIFHNSIKQQFQDEGLTEKNWVSLVEFNYNKIKKLSMPIHIFHGEKDLLVDPMQAKKLASLCAHASVDFIPHSGHMPPVETPGALARLIKDYLVKE